VAGHAERSRANIPGYIPLLLDRCLLTEDGPKGLPRPRKEAAIVENPGRNGFTLHRRGTIAARTQILPQ